MVAKLAIVPEHARMDCTSSTKQPGTRCLYRWRRKTTLDHPAGACLHRSMGECARSLRLSGAALSSFVPGTGAARHRDMSLTSGRNPKSYDEIVRETVLDPDSSVRPSLDLEQAARDGEGRAASEDERALHDSVVHALTTAGIDGVTVEVHRDLVVLHGRVTDTTRLRALEDIVANISGVTRVRNQVVVDSSRGS